MRFVGPGTAMFCLVIVGCATSTSSTKNPNIASELRAAERSEADDALTREMRAQQLFIRGLTEARLGRHEEALDLYAEAVQLAPRTAAILAAIAESHEVLGDEDAALYNLRRARETAPDNPYYALQLAKLHLTMGDAEEAARAYNNVLEQSPHNLDALYELARVYTMNGQLERAVSTYERLMDEIGSDRDVQNQILQLYARLEDLSGMERVLRELLKEQPQETQLRRMLAEVYLKQGRQDDAVAELQTALETDPRDAQSMLALAELYREMGRAADADALMVRSNDLSSTNTDQLLAHAKPLYARADDDNDAHQAAKQILERILHLEPENEEALLMLGNLHLDEEAFEEAGGLFYRAVEANPRAVQVWMQASSAYLQAGRLERAADVADEALMLFPGSVPLLRIAGYALMDAYENREAIRHFQEAVDVIREDRSEDATGLAALYSALGLLYTRTGDAERSDESYELALEADADHAPALNNYAYNLAQREERLDDALEMAQRAVELEPDVPAYLDTLGWVYFRLGEHEEALRHIERAAARADASAAVVEHLGDVYQALGREDRAAEAWNRAFDMNPDSAILKKKLGRE